LRVKLYYYVDQTGDFWPILTGQTLGLLFMTEQKRKKRTPEERKASPSLPAQKTEEERHQAGDSGNVSFDPMTGLAGMKTWVCVTVHESISDPAWQVQVEFRHQETSQVISENEVKAPHSLLTGRACPDRGSRQGKNIHQDPSIVSGGRKDEHYSWFLHITGA